MGRKGLKVAVAHINVLLIDIFLQVSMVCRRRIIPDSAGYGIRKLAAGRHTAADHIRCRAPAFLSAVPHVQHGRNRIFPGKIQKTHVDDAGNVQNHRGSAEILCDRPKELFLLCAQAETAGKILIVLRFSGRTANHHQSLVRSLCSRSRKFLIHLHLLLTPGFPGPYAAPIVKWILPDPFLIHGRKLFIHLQIITLPQAVQQVRRIGSVHRTA